MGDFHIVTAVTALLVTFGIVMVLSSSSVESYVADGSSYARVVPQAQFALLGAVVFVVAVRVPTRVLRQLAAPAMLVALLLLVAVLLPGIGDEQNGSRGWIMLGSIGFQPSELAKAAFIVWGAHLVALAVSREGHGMSSLKALLTVSLLVMGLVLAERDMGQTVTLAIIMMALVWFGLFSMRLIGAMAAVGTAAFAILATTVGYRSERIRAFLNPDYDPLGMNYQATQAKYALASGGVFGAGLGQGKSKWSYLPQAYNDFIFAVIGEEFGLVGGTLTLGLFAVLLWCGLRIASRSLDPFLRIMAATITTFIVVQAFINIAYVVGLIPVTGLQLPLISAGGTSMLATMAMAGLIAHCAWREPEALASLRASGGAGLAAKIFGVPAGYTPPARKRRAPAPKVFPAKRVSAVEASRRRARRSDRAVEGASVTELRRYAPSAARRASEAPARASFPDSSGEPPQPGLRARR
jgi:cell division protein FtsW